MTAMTGLRRAEGLSFGAYITTHAVSVFYDQGWILVLDSDGRYPVLSFSLTHRGGQTNEKRKEVSR